MNGSVMGEMTQRACDAIWNMPFIESEETPDMQALCRYLTDESNFSVFSKELAEILINKNGALTDFESKLNYLVTKSKEKGIDIERNTLKNWLGGKSNPQGNSASRQNIYKLCFLLDFDLKETADFFVKVYLDRPFNYRKAEELVYAFCMNNGFGYAKATQLINEIESERLLKETMPLAHTGHLGGDVLKLKTVDELKAFIKNDPTLFEFNNVTAVNHVQRLMEYCRQKIAECSGKKVSVNDVLAEIYNVNVEDLLKERVTNTFSKSSAFLDIVKTNFPQKQLYTAIIKNKASYHVIRKFLILLHFYFCYGNVSPDEEKYGFDDYLESADDMLTECGYSPLYYRNPYDWMFLCCASFDDPLLVFYEIMSIMFSDKCLEDN